MSKFKRIRAILAAVIVAASICTGCGRETVPAEVKVVSAEAAASLSPTATPKASIQPIQATATDSGAQDEVDSTDAPHSVAGGDVLSRDESYEAAKALNDEVIGWITVDGTVIDYPVVRTDDNEYYMGRDAEKNEAPHGSIFMDYRNADPTMQKHIILYGHYRKDGSMFHDLMNYKQSDYFKTYNTIYFLWDGVETEWKIFLAYIVTPNTIYHIHTEFLDDQNFADVMNETIEYAKTVKPSNYDPSVTIRAGDQVLTLSTCTYEYNDSYFAVMARRVK